ncbi:DNA-binding domain-containing protein [Synoicihabitans lomoniglobus]|uniref:DNA-binding domain-containing protein n=1 Tax=Synoicihabitans lomoniglobus TaxID=2909285 RepID=A0AAF0CGA4_9BACT|nr:DNA-binding domain-containing protein [Opitutaceae bacterium LMO-M01]WED63347.1 DNA-binding domain-containing protein [Opitutaceae bacterium LMO-M01]
MIPFESLQRWLLAAIQQPQSKDVREIESVVANANGRLPPAARIGIYAASFHGRLIQCLESEYPVLRHALEEDLFHQFATGYLQTFPPTTYTLTRLGENFPRHLRETRPDNEAELWPEFIINLATLERTFFEVYHAEGHEKTTPKPATDPVAIAAEPWTRTLHLAFPVHDYFPAARLHLKEPEIHAAPDIPAPRSTTVLIYRRNFQVRLREIADNAGQ